VDGIRIRGVSMNDNNQRTKIIGIAMMASILQFVGVLIFLKKITIISLPQGNLSLVESVAMGASLLFLFSFIVFKKKVQNEKNEEEKFKFLIISYALNELPVGIAFAATLISGTENGLFMALNAGVALILDLIFFAKTN
jgi:hypothetical protein